MKVNSNSKYLEIHRKIDIPCGAMSIRNRFTYYPLYDVDKNSYIRRYRLWLRYKEKCIKEGRPFVDVKQYGKILNAMSKEIKEQLILDQDGVVFKDFVLKIIISSKKNFILQIKGKLRKKGISSLNNWGILLNRLFKDRLRKLYKQNKMIDFEKLKPKQVRTIADKLDIFDEF
jgi:hypothetical protein